MPKIPQIDGDTIADVIIWKWDRGHMRWSTTLKDDIEIRVRREMLSRRAYWTIMIDYPGQAQVVFDSTPHKTPDAAQEAALERVKAWRLATHKAQKP